MPITRRRDNASRITGRDTPKRLASSLSAGSRPSGRVNPKAVAAMAELGYDLTTHTSKGLDDYNGTEIDAAVTMGCGDACPLVKAKHRFDWQIPDPREMQPEEFRKVRDLIGGKVRELLRELGAFAV